MESPNGRNVNADTFQRLRNAASNWTINDDKLMLEILENIHKKVITDARDTKKKCDSQFHVLNEASVSLMNVNNRFAELSNTQFIENIVGEDDIVIIENNKVKNDEAVANEKLKADQIKVTDDDEERLKDDVCDAIVKSLQTLESLCEEIRISSDSDTESEDDEKHDREYNIVLRPKNIYAKRKLPCIIGSQKWKKYWHAGLQECSSTENSEDETETNDDVEYSDSEESPKNAFNKNKMFTNEDFSATNKTLSSANSTSTVNSSDTYESENAKLFESVPKANSIDKDIPRVKPVEKAPAPQTLVKASDFAAELARKLGGPPTSVNEIKSKTSGVENTKNTETHKAAPSSYAYLPNKPDTRITGNIFLDEPPPLEAQSENKPTVKNVIDDVSAGLFGDDSDDDLVDSIFQPAKTLVSAKPKASYAGLFDDVPEDDDIFDSKNNITKQIDTLNQQKLNKTTTPKPVAQPKAKIVNKIQQTTQSQLKTNQISIVKKESIFDDSGSEDDMFGPKTSYVQKKTDIKENLSTTQPKLNVSSSLFDDLSDSDSDLFNVSKTSQNKNIKPILAEKYNKSNNSKTEKAEVKTVKPEIERKPENVVNKEIVLEKSQEKHEKEKSNIKEKSNDFNKSTDDKNKETISEAPGNYVTGLFDETPPPLDSSNYGDISAYSESENLLSNSMSKSVLFDDDNAGPNKVDIFSDVPPEYVIEETEVSPKDDFGNDYSDYPYYKTVNKVESPEEPPKAKSDSGSNDLFGDKKSTLFDDDDESDFFSGNKNTKTDSAKVQKKPNPSTKNDFLKKSTLFNDSSDSELFLGKENVKPTVPKIDSSSYIPKKIYPSDKSNLFTDGSESESVSVKENISSDNTSITSKFSTSSNLSIKSDSQISMKSDLPINSNLFDDDGSDSELFSPKINSSIPKNNSSSNAPKKTDLSPLIKTDSSDRDNLFVDGSDSGLFSKRKNVDQAKASAKESSVVSTSDDSWNISKKTDSPPLSTKSNLFDDLSDSEQFTESVKPSMKPFKESPPKGLNEIEKKDATKSTQKIGKLQSNLNINVKALLPGVKNKTIKDIKTINEDNRTEVDNVPIAPSVVKVEDDNSSKNSTISKVVSFDEKPSPLEDSKIDTLCNDIVKNRAKINVKRRPSTRQARHEAVRKSAIDIYPEVNDLEQKNDEKFVASLPNSPKKENFESTAINETKSIVNEAEKTSKIFEESYEELFSSTNTVSRLKKNEKLAEPLFKTPSKAVKKPQSKGIFDDSDSDSDLFSGLVTKKDKRPIPKQSIFDDDDSDDIFSAGSKSIPRSEPKGKTAPQKTTTEAKNKKPTALFSDESDEDFDIFSTRKSANQSSSTTSVKKISKKSETKKAATTQSAKENSTFQDPLSSFLNG